MDRLTVGVCGRREGPFVLLVPSTVVPWDSKFLHGTHSRPTTGSSPSAATVILTTARQSRTQGSSSDRSGPNGEGPRSTY